MINNKLSIINRDLLIINHCIECLLCSLLPVPLLSYDVRHPDMSRVVQGKTDGEDEDDAGGDLNGQSHKVGATSYLQQSQGHTEKDQNAHNEVGDQEKIHDGDCSKSKTYVS